MYLLRPTHSQTSSSSSPNTFLRQHRFLLWNEVNQILKNTNAAECFQLSIMKKTVRCRLYVSRCPEFHGQQPMSSICKVTQALAKASDNQLIVGFRHMHLILTFRGFVSKKNPLSLEIKALLFISQCIGPLFSQAHCFTPLFYDHIHLFVHLSLNNEDPLTLIKTLIYHVKQPQQWPMKLTRCFEAVYLRVELYNVPHCVVNIMLSQSAH